MSEEQRILRRYLSRYRALKVKEDYLQRELDELRKDFETSAFHAMSVEGGGGGAMAFSPVPTYVMKNQEILGKIAQRKEITRKALNEILEVIELLPDKGYENTVVSCKYISRMSCDEIAEFIPCGRTTVFRVLDRAMDMLLEIPKVQDILKNYSESLKE